MSDGCQNYDRGQLGPRKPKSEPPVRSSERVRRLPCKKHNVWDDQCADCLKRTIKQLEKPWLRKVLDDAKREYKKRPAWAKPSNVEVSDGDE